MSARTTKILEPTGQCIFRTLSSFFGLFDNLREKALGTAMRFFKLFEVFFFFFFFFVFFFLARYSCWCVILILILSGVLNDYIINFPSSHFHDGALPARPAHSEPQKISNSCLSSANVWYRWSCPRSPSPFKGCRPNQHHPAFRPHCPLHIPKCLS